MGSGRAQSRLGLGRQEEAKGHDKGAGEQRAKQKQRTVPGDGGEAGESAPRGQRVPPSAPLHFSSLPLGLQHHPPPHTSEPLDSELKVRPGLGQGAQRYRKRGAQQCRGPVGLTGPSCCRKDSLQGRTHTSADTQSHAPGTVGMTDKERKGITDCGANLSGFKSTCHHLTAGGP